ncbi:uncharacterized protein MELLADRAFT_104926 [Melampsora larici-populina 98AG31]|uniref:Secreted protein n=1 Tax=Melampsora larici-populina (strain 98AG31 / pathotype 3-4-7) TaxID=747676 RepID=F4RGJ2_MELLP|nr:uncharacterized protein MELLADRAFT_104926 [Melampsora larici-populina 98AG31]EGG08641.1 secreted protein [Melampsora larici-populina 98AG31]
MLVLSPVILADHVPGHVVMFFEMHGDKVHVVPQNMGAEKHENKKESHSKRSQKEEISEQDPYTTAQSKSDSLSTILKSALGSIPSVDNQDDDDDDGKVENHIPGYKNNPVTTPLSESITDEWTKLIGDCDHNSSLDPTATSACHQRKKK